MKFSKKKKKGKKKPTARREGNLGPLPAFSWNWPFSPEVLYFFLSFGPCSFVWLTHSFFLSFIYSQTFSKLL
jgi:hypothetical protein